jgi:hypothetical protein
LLLLSIGRNQIKKKKEKEKEEERKPICFRLCMFRETSKPKTSEHAALSVGG